MSEATPTPAAPAAPAPTPTPTPAPAAAATPTEWTASLKPELKDFVAQRQFKDPSAVVESYINFEKLKGVPQERLLKLPEKSDDPEWNGIFERLGKPKTPDEYGIKAPEGEDASFADWAKSTFHEANLSTAQANKLMEKWREFGNGKVNDSESKFKADTLAQDQTLKKEWGQAYEQNVKIAERAKKAFGFNDEVCTSIAKTIGLDGLSKLLNGLGQKLGEGNYVSGEQQGNFGDNILAPAQAQARIKALKSDPTFKAQWTKGDMEARTKLQKLHEMAYPGDKS